MAIRIGPDELGPLQTVMRDLQLSASSYYAASGSGQDLGSSVRALISQTQTINDWLLNVIADASSYQALFGSARHPLADYIDAVKYARNVSEHVMHIIRPDDRVTLVGGVLGMRVYAHWDEIPASAHALLRRNTQSLKPAYDSMLSGNEVMSTMMAVLRFYADVAPDIVHRDENGEWTGFPVLSQPGMANALHPEEPLDAEAARRWMDSRRPGGDLRIITGRIALDDTQYVVGYTFDRGCSFAPFSETAGQVNRDIGLGYRYFTGDLTANVEDATERFPDALQGVVLGSLGDIASWATPVANVENDEAEWLASGEDDEEWRRVVRLESGVGVPEVWKREVRRARRLNALLPPSFSHGQR